MTKPLYSRHHRTLGQLPPFSRDAVCPKCLCDTITSRWVADGCSTLECTSGTCAAEHIARHCSTCHYEWPEGCADRIANVRQVATASGTDVQMLAELERGPFTSLRNACERMEVRFRVGSTRTRTLLGVLIQSGHIEQITSRTTSYRAVPSTYSKDMKAAIDELKRAEFVARQGERAAASE